MPHGLSSMISREKCVTRSSRPGVSYSAILKSRPRRRSSSMKSSTELSPRQVATLITGLIGACDNATRLLGDRHAIRDAEHTFERLFPTKSHV